MRTILTSIITNGSSKLILVLAFFLLIPSNGSLLAGPSDSRQPLWEIDLSQFGYQGRPPVPQGPADEWGFWTYQQGVVFTQSGVMAVFFVVHDDPPGASANRKPSPSDPYRLVALFLDANRGALIRKLDWPLPSSTDSVSPSFFFSAMNGNFIVGIGETLSLYSTHFELLAKYEFHQELDATASGAGDTVLLKSVSKIDGKWISRSDLVDTDRLSLRKSWEGRPQLNQSLWGDEQAWTSNRSLNLRTADGAPKHIFESEKELCGYWSFLNSDTIAVTQCGGPEKLLVVSTEGTSIQEFDFGSEQMDGPAVASRDGRRFAVPSYEWGVGDNVDPQQLKTRVFDVGNEHPILTLEVRGHYGASANFHTPEGDTRFGWGGLALSPEGDLLAVKSGPILQLYRLPDPGRPSH